MGTPKTTNGKTAPSLADAKRETDEADKTGVAASRLMTSPTMRPTTSESTRPLDGGPTE